MHTSVHSAHSQNKNDPPLLAAFAITFAAIVAELLKPRAGVVIDLPEITDICHNKDFERPLS